MKECLRFSLLLFMPFILNAQDSAAFIPSNVPPYIPVTKTWFYQLGDRNIPVQVMQFGPATGIVCINLHDNESTSVSAATSVLEETGGTLIKIENNNERLIRFRLKGHNYVFDPNRMFSKKGIAASLKKTGRSKTEAVLAIDRFAKQVLNMIPESDWLIALHNNTDGNYSVNSYLPGHEYDVDALDVIKQEDQDEDDIIFTTDSTLFKKAGELGFNSILQDNINANQDGSLSVFYGNMGRRYVNIETETGKEELYRKMLGIVLAVLTTGKPF